MRVRMRVRMTGSRDGQDWPPVGGLLDVSDEEGNALLRAGIAQAAGLDEAENAPPTVDEATGRATTVETATAGGDEETAAEPGPRSKAARRAAPTSPPEPPPEPPAARPGPRG